MTLANHLLAWSPFGPTSDEFRAAVKNVEEHDVFAALRARQVVRALTIEEYDKNYSTGDPNLCDRNKAGVNLFHQTRRA